MTIDTPSLSRATPHTPRMAVNGLRAGVGVHVVRFLTSWFWCRERPTGWGWRAWYGYTTARTNAG